MKKNHNSSFPSDLVIAQAIAALIYAPDWPKTRRVLEEQQSVLLSDRALELVSLTIDQLHLQAEVEDARIWKQYRLLLYNARKFGIAIAWNLFMQAQKEVTRE